jgi:hypothetical protein
MVDKKWSNKCGGARRRSVSRGRRSVKRRSVSRGRRSVKRRSVSRGRRSVKRRSVSRGRRSSGSRVRIPIEHPGALAKYHVDDKLKTKRAALDSYVKKDGYATIIRRLNVLSIYNKNRNPKMSEKIKRDISYLQKKH